MGEMKIDETLESAVKIFQNQIGNYGALEGYQVNNEKFPMDCSELFKIYFDSAEWENELQLDMQSIQNILAGEKEKEEKCQALLRYSSMRKRR